MVTVIMASHDKAGFVSESLDSVIAQSLQEWELIAVDDASSDGTWEILERYSKLDPRIRIERRSHCSGGPAAPRNRALALARGEWTAVLDADDLWHAEKLERQVSAALDQDVGFCSTAAISFDGGSPRLVGDPEGGGIRFLDHRRLLRKNVVAASSVLVCTEMLRAVGFPEERRYRRVEDACCWLRIHRDLIPRSPQLGEQLTFYRTGAPWRLKPTMAWRRFGMLRRHEVQGAPLGTLGALPCMASYAWSSVAATLTTGGSFRSA